MNCLRTPLFQSALVLGLVSPMTVQAEQVIFSEIQYNAKAGLPDFIEITNNTATPFDTGGWFFSDGIIFTFPDFDAANPSAHILKHFETILVSPVEEADLRAAYPGIPDETRIFGPYSGALSNSGETLELSDKNGIVLTTIDYNDGRKWPAAADGTGHSLIRVNPTVSPTVSYNSGSIGFSYRQRINGGEISYQVERSTDLVNWEPAGDLSPSGDPVSNPDGTFTIILLSNLPHRPQGKTYYRLVVSLP